MRFRSSLIFQYLLMCKVTKALMCEVTKAGINCICMPAIYVYIFVTIRFLRCLLSQESSQLYLLGRDEGTNRTLRPGGACQLYTNLTFHL